MEWRSGVNQRQGPLVATEWMGSCDGWEEKKKMMKKEKKLKFLGFEILYGLRSIEKSNKNFNKTTRFDIFVGI